MLAKTVNEIMCQICITIHRSIAAITKILKPNLNMIICLINIWLQSHIIRNGKQNNKPIGYEIEICKPMITWNYYVYNMHVKQQ
jgi:hypothetical protein